MNYILFIGFVGFKIEIYLYFDKVLVSICFDVMMEIFCKIEKGDIVFLYGCCYNFIGVDFINV